MTARWRSILGLFAAVLLPSLPSVAEMPPPADPRVVMARAYDRAVAADTNAALILFLARHPDDPLSDDARQRLSLRTAPDPVPGDGPDGALIARFDAARLAGRSALDRFAERYAGHPLAVEAARPIWRAR